MSLLDNNEMLSSRVDVKKGLKNEEIISVYFHKYVRYFQKTKIRKIELLFIIQKQKMTAN